MEDVKWTPAKPTKGKKTCMSPRPPLKKDDPKKGKKTAKA